MSTMTVHGYVDGVAYAVRTDTTANDEVRGIITHGSPDAVAEVGARAGLMVRLAHTGAPVEVSVRTPAGVLAGLAAGTEIVRVEGDVPPEWPGAEPEDEQADGPVVH